MIKLPLYASRTIEAALVAMAVGFVAPHPAAAARIIADSPDDVCAPDADPCVIDSVVVVRDGTTLDFGTRALNIVGKGQLRLAGEGIEILSAGLSADTAGRRVLWQRRGATHDASATIRSMGICTGIDVLCNDDSDCSAGTCAVAVGRMEFQGSIRSAFLNTQYLKLHASGDILLHERTTSRRMGSSAVDVMSHHGSITVDGQVDLESAEDSYVVYDARANVVLGAETRLAGKYGGELEVLAVGDVTVTRSIDVSSNAGSGDGGYVYLSAYLGLLHIAGGSGGFVTRVVADGTKRSMVEDGGGGGYIELDGEKVEVDPNVELLARPASARARGGAIEIYSGAGGTEMNGSARAGGESGLVGLLCLGNIRIGSSASIRTLTGPDLEGGALWIVSLNSDVMLAGSVSLSGGSDSGDPNVQIEGCHVTFEGTSQTSQLQKNGKLLVVARESLDAQTGSSIQGSAAGNELRYRSGASTPVLEGVITPPPVLIPDAALTPCP